MREDRQTPARKGPPSPHPQDGPLGLDDEQIGRYAAMFADPEAPCRLPDGKTFMIPVHPIG